MQVREVQRLRDVVPVHAPLPHARAESEGDIRGDEALPIADRVHAGHAARGATQNADCFGIARRQFDQNVFAPVLRQQVLVQGSEGVGREPGRVVRLFREKMSNDPRTLRDTLQLGVRFAEDAQLWRGNEAPHSRFLQHLRRRCEGIGSVGERQQRDVSVFHYSTRIGVCMRA